MLSPSTASKRERQKQEFLPFSSFSLSLPLGKSQEMYFDEERT